MTSIGSGPASITEPLEIAVLRPVGAADAGIGSRTAGASIQATPTDTLTGTARVGDSAPIDHDRVASIKKAIATNSYPLIPTKIGDAMIAAGMVLRMPR